MASHGIGVESAGRDAVGRLAMGRLAGPAKGRQQAGFAVAGLVAFEMQTDSQQP